MLPEIREGVSLDIPHFPTKFQAVIFRLWESVPAKKIAQVLKTDEKTVNELASEMGLPHQEDTRMWQSRGYISILRHVWNILPYNQICDLLDWTQDRLEFILKEDDFLDIKLCGNDRKKTDCSEVVYRPLTDAEKEKTAFIKSTVTRDILPLNDGKTEECFDFFAKRYAPISRKISHDVTLDSAWAVKFDCDEVSDYVDDFKSEVKEIYNIEFAPHSERNIEIRTDVDLPDEEYHEIHIKETNILINAASPIGVMRALYYILDLANGAGGLTFSQKSYRRKTKVKSRIIYSFCGLYGDVLDKDSNISFPDELIKGYARQGINGVWIQGIFYKIAPYPFDESKCKGWQKRLRNLDTLTRRLEKYGIKVYMYINEPRNMPDEFFAHNSDLRGTPKKTGLSCLCSSNNKTHKYLSDSIRTICTNVPLLGGFITITQGENSVLCYSGGIQKFKECQNAKLPYGYCPVCAKKKASEVVANIIRTMSDAAHSINKNIKFFAYAWGWQRHFGDELDNLLNNLPKDVIVLQVSESAMEFERGGIKNTVMDYSLSIVGPGEPASKLWQSARIKGLEIGAKVQINNSWECSTAPFLPVYENVVNHISNLTNAGIEHIMLSWTLGGYISDNIKIASAFFFEDDQSINPYDSILEMTYGEYSKMVKSAVSHFCRGFGEYPFDCEHIYFGPSNAGAGNIIYPEPTGMKATMTCYPFDDIQTWCANVYTPEILKNQYHKLCIEWEKGLEIIKDMPNCEFKDMAYYGYTLFKSSLNQITYYMLRDGGGDKHTMHEVIENEKSLALMVYEIMLRNSSVGYEAANHYYVTRSSLMEKIINCDYIISQL